MKLLNRTIIHYLLYAVTVVLLSIPVFYFVIDRLFTGDVDETLLLRKQEVQFRIKNIRSDEDIRLWEKLDGDIQLNPSDRMGRDSSYSIVRYDSLADEMEPHRVLSSYIQIREKPYHLVLTVSLVESDDLISAIVKVQTFLLVLLVGGLIVVNGLVSKTIWKPFYQTLEKLKQFEMDKNPVMKLDKSRVKEFEDLNRAIKQLADRNYEAYIHQKEFTENAAHEMQTPLAIFQSKLELLLQSVPTEEQSHLIQSLMDSTSRLNRLNRNLLLLSKIDNNQFVETESIGIASMTNQLVTAFQEQISRKKLQVATQLKDEVEVKMNRSLLEMLLSNLLANAIKHNEEGGTIEIIMTSAAWTISNTGPVLSVPPTTMFRRFQKGNQHTAGLGLGLAIAKRICESYLMEISYHFEGGRHVLALRF